MVERDTLTAAHVELDGLAAGWWFGEPEGLLLLRGVCGGCICARGRSCVACSHGAVERVDVGAGGKTFGGGGGEDVAVR